MENNTNDDQNERHFRRAVSLEPTMNLTEREPTDERPIQVNPLFDRNLNQMPEERNSSLRRHVSEPSRNQHRIVSNVVTRAESIKSMVLRGTQQFFGLSEDNNTNDDIWRQRGRRLLSKHGRIKQSVSQTRGATDVTGFDEIDGNLYNNRMTGFTDNRRIIFSDTNPEDLSRKPALKVTFKAIALASNSFKKKKPNLDRRMAEEESDERHSQSVPTDIRLSDEETEEDFFVREAETPEDDDVIDGRRDIKWRIQRQVSVRDQSIPEKLIQTFLRIDNSNRRQLGMGLIDRLLNRKLRKNLTKEERKAIGDHIDDFRPYFTYWITTVQILILTISLFTYGFGYFGFGFAHITGLVLVKSRSQQQVDYYEPQNFWGGPRSADLIHLGAKYTPCMRRDEKIYDIIEEERNSEANTGCCIRNDNSGCVQTLKDKCSALLSTWHKWDKSNSRNSGPVCGQDPNYCQQPASVDPYQWADDITKWPICLKKRTELSGSVPHMKCELLAHPCCLGVSGQCHILTREHCQFIKGFFHEEATLCSQVSCMENVCGMIRFYSTDIPDQLYRIFTPIFLHAGIIHLLITGLFQMFIMRDIEKMIGSTRMAIIYIVSGIGGYLSSAVFLPFRPEVGPAGAHYGVMACLFVEFINLWHIYEEPIWPLLKLIAVALFLLLLGLLPWIDNYAHCMGLFIGLLLSLAFMPDVTLPIKGLTQQEMSEHQRRRKLRIIQIVVCLLTVLSIIFTLIVMLYKVPIYDIKFFKYFNCIPFTSDWCANQDIQVQRVDIL